MERATKHYGDRYVALNGCTIKDAIKQLVSYEDAMPLERVEELAQAEKDGRLVVLPCNVGYKVYHITTCEHFPQVLDGTMYGSNGGPGTATGRYCPYELSETCPFDVNNFDCDINKKNLAVFEDKVVSIYIDDCEMFVGLCSSGSVDILDFGKTVFLTREEAETALKKREEENNEAD